VLRIVDPVQDFVLNSSCLVYNDVIGVLRAKQHHAIHCVTNVSYYQIHFDMENDRIAVVDQYSRYSI